MTLDQQDEMFFNVIRHLRPDWHTTMEEPLQDGVWFGDDSDQHQFWVDCSSYKPEGVWLFDWGHSSGPRLKAQQVNDDPTAAVATLAKYILQGAPNNARRQ